MAHMACLGSPRHPKAVLSVGETACPSLKFVISGLLRLHLQLRNLFPSIRRLEN